MASNELPATRTRYRSQGNEFDTPFRPRQRHPLANQQHDVRRQRPQSIGPYGAIAAGIAIAITLIVDLIVALWAPADLIIEDPTGYSLLDLAERTGADFPLPDATRFTTEGDIDVKVKPQEKIPTQYRELREYVSDDEDSRYEILFRFNRTV